MKLRSFISTAAVALGLSTPALATANVSTETPRKPLDRTSSIASARTFGNSEDMTTARRTVNVITGSIARFANGIGDMFSGGTRHDHRSGSFGHSLVAVAA